MTVHLPADYRWRSPTAQDPNFVGTGYGEVHVKGLKGTLPDGRDFKFWASNPLSSVSKPPMVIENVEGRIIASCWGNLTMTGCTEICMAYSEGDTVLEILGPGGSLSNTIMASGPLTIRVKTGTNLSFYNEPLFEDSIWFLNNEGKPDIAGPVDVTDGSIPYRKVTTGNGGGNTAAFIVTVAGGSVTYKRLE